VFLELCESRRGVLEDVPIEEEFSYTDMLKKFQTGEANAFSIIYSYYLRSIADTLKVRPGGEFKAANDAAMSVSAAVVLGDRPVLSLSLSLLSLLAMSVPTVPLSPLTPLPHLSPLCGVR
jgi:pheromone shutdown protein TraB